MDMGRISKPGAAYFSQNRPRPQGPQGMFGGGSSGMYTPGFQSSGPQSFDLSGISEGAKRLQNAPAYNPTAYKPFQFTTPQYGTTSPKEMQNIYEQALGVAERPVRSQAQEQMRQMSQGFEGGRFTGAAQREAALKQGQATGEQVAGIGKDIGSQLAQSRLGEQQTARQAMFGAEMDRQRQQAEEGYKAAGFTDDQARYMAQDSLNRAQQFMQYGFQLPQLQQQLGQSQQQMFQGILQQLSQLGGLG